MYYFRAKNHPFLGAAVKRVSLAQERSYTGCPDENDAEALVMGQSGLRF